MKIKRWEENDKYRVILDYNPVWIDVFHALKSSIPLIHSIVDIHHIGSTAIHGCAAKPMIDMLVECVDRDEIQPAIQLFLKMGYHRRDTWADTKDKPYLAGHCRFRRNGYNINVHFSWSKAPDLIALLSFCDTLNRDNALIAVYSQIKRDAYVATGGEPMKYNAMKEGFIHSIIKQR